jgi:predicted  nucleic acid-binding Zn-ribbon protein
MKLRRNGRDHNLYERLDRLAVGLKQHGEQLHEAEGQSKAAEQAEQQIDSLAADLVAGTLAPADFERERAARTTKAAEARHRRDGLRAIVKAAKAAFEEELRQVASHEIGLCDQERERLNGELAEAQARVHSLAAALQLVEERRASFRYQEDGWLRLKARYDPTALDVIKRRREERKRERHHETPAERAARHEGEAAGVLSVRTVDGDGRVVPAYARIVGQDRLWERR